MDIARCAALKPRISAYGRRHLLRLEPGPFIKIKHPEILLTEILLRVPELQRAAVDELSVTAVSHRPRSRHQSYYMPSNHINGAIIFKMTTSTLIRGPKIIN